MASQDGVKKRLIGNYRCQRPFLTYRVTIMFLNWFAEKYWKLLFMHLLLFKLKEYVYDFLMILK